MNDIGFQRPNIGPYISESVAMDYKQVVARLNDKDVAVDRLLDETRAPDLELWKDHPDLYPAFVKRLLERGHPGRALELGHEGTKHLKDDSHLQYLLALAAARGGATQYAEALLAPLLARAEEPAERRPADMSTALRVDIIALRGRLFKDRAEREPGLAITSAQWYEKAAKAATDGLMASFPLINAATMWRVADNPANAAELAAEVVALVADRAEAAAAAGDMWPAATLGEAFLLLGEHEKAIAWYQRAVGVATADGRVGDLVPLRANIRRLRAVGATADPSFLDVHLGKVVVFSGHMLDSPERQAAGMPPRFPRHPDLVAKVATAIRERLKELNAKVGYCSLACGGDILFAEAMLERGAELHVVLPFAQSDFLRTSVDFNQDGPERREWRQRFDTVLARVERESKARVRYVTQEPYLGSRELFALANTVLQGLAVLRGRERVSDPTALVLLDRGSGDAPGGTADFLATWTAAGLTAEVIDLAALRAATPTPPPPAERPAPPAARSALPRPVKMMLFADVAGYSNIQEWQLPAFLTAYGDFLRALLASDVGRAAVYANTWGDGIYAVFDRAADAAAFATELVEPTIGRAPDWADFDLGPTNPMRVGLHAGPVFELRDLFQGRSEFAGQHVTRAARIEPVTVRGCAYASEPFAALLAADGRFAVEAVGVHSLAKNYDRCPLYRVQRTAAS